MNEISSKKTIGKGWNKKIHISSLPFLGYPGAH